MCITLVHQGGESIWLSIYIYHEQLSSLCHFRMSLLCHGFIIYKALEKVGIIKHIQTYSCIIFLKLQNFFDWHYYFLDVYNKSYVIIHWSYIWEFGLYMLRSKPYYVLTYFLQYFIWLFGISYSLFWSIKYMIYDFDDLDQYNLVHSSISPEVCKDAFFSL